MLAHEISGASNRLNYVFICVEFSRLILVFILFRPLKSGTKGKENTLFRLLYALPFSIQRSFFTRFMLASSIRGSFVVYVKRLQEPVGRELSFFEIEQRESASIEPITTLAAAMPTPRQLVTN